MVIVSLLDEFGGVAERYQRVYRDVFGEPMPTLIAPSDDEMEAVVSLRSPLLLDPQVRAFYQGFPLSSLGWVDVNQFNTTRLDRIYKHDIEGAVESATLRNEGLPESDAWAREWGVLPGGSALPIGDAGHVYYVVDSAPDGSRLLAFEGGYSEFPRCTVCARDLLSFVTAVVTLAERGLLEPQTFENVGWFSPAGIDSDAYVDVLDECGVNEDIFGPGAAHRIGRAAFPDGL